MNKMLFTWHSFVNLNDVKQKTQTETHEITKMKRYKNALNCFARD